MRTGNLAWLLATGGLMVWTGCNGGTAVSPAPVDGGHAEHGHAEHGHDEHTGSAHSDAAHAGHDHAHDHQAVGPHGGHIVEIGAEEYHAEWTHNNDSGEVSIYLLDAAMKSDVSIASDSVVIEATIDGKPLQFVLTAVRKGDATQASHFTATDKSLIEVLGAAGHGVEPVLKVTIGDKAYTVPIEHQHDAHGHKH